MNAPPPGSATLAIGPINNAGQAHAWAQAVDTFTDHAAWSFGFAPPPGRRPPLQFSATRRLPHHRITPDALKAVLVRRMLRGASHVAVDSFASLYRRLDRSHLGVELDRLQRDLPRASFALIAHGSDLRDPQQHAERLAESYYRIAPAEWNASLGEAAARNRETARRSALPLFVSTPDLLLEDVPATWLPVVVDPVPFAGAPPPFSSGRRPRVLHLPSRRTPPIKGTDLVDPLLTRLHDEGRVEYVSPASVHPAEVPALVRSCDVLIEQVRSGYYGANAIEGMAAGRVVVGSLADDVAALMPEPPPMIRVRHDGLEEAIERVLSDATEARDLASRGPGFVRRWHDGRSSARVLATWMETRSPVAPAAAPTP
ncbi:glycosyltransferase [Mobilicoccus massiliensis]|uniref:glycosyltransferase n=1 Tax=Mobilicoccus massiliensis TaxID=1522310 RepID=UPI0006944950|nr:hypothetical protein [Mobilicoccus massiliensis]